MSAWRLGELAVFLGDAALAGDDVAVGGLAIDSRRVEPGDLFAALPGAREDGRAYIDEALARGAAALLLPDDDTAKHPVPRLLCARPREAASLLAQHLAGDPSHHLKLLGVTGTNGKSTCVHLLQHLLHDDHRAWDLLGTLRFKTGSSDRTASHTTPDPVSLAALLAESRAADREGLCMEVSSHALDQDRVAGCRFAGVLYTNLSRDHLDYHGDMDRYLAAKARLLALRAPKAPALINLDEPHFAKLLGRGEGLLTFGRHPLAQYRIHAERLSAGGSTFELVWPEGSLRCATVLPGDFNVSNAAGCLALALAIGAKPEILAHRLARFPGVPGRMERLGLAGGPQVIVDFAHSPDAVARVLTACRPLCRGRLVAVLGAGGDRDRGKRLLMGQAAQRHADLVVLTSDNPRSEDPAAILAEIESGMDRSAGSWHKEVDRARAIRLALGLCAEEDLLVLLGKGHERTQEIAGTFLPFDDREEVRAAWREREQDS